MALSDVQVRNLHYGTAGLAVLLLLLGLAVLTGGANATARLVLLAVLVVLLAVQVWLFLQDRKSIAEAGQAWTPPADDVAPTPPADDAAPKMVIRCKQCANVFPVVDTGVRPLVAHCPHCGKEGTIRTKTQA